MNVIIRLVLHRFSKIDIVCFDIIQPFYIACVVTAQSQ